MNSKFDKKVLDHITAAQHEAAELMMQAHGILAECKTGHRDVVTQYDRRIQELLMQRLSRDVPGAHFFCEENGQQDPTDAEHLFIIDPIDGTMNFVRGFGHSCISVAYMSRGELRAASVYNPYLDEQFTALAGEGAWLNGRQIHADGSPLSETIVCCGTSPYRPELAEQSFDAIKRLFLASLDIRREGSAALDMCSAAAGRAGVYYELSVSLWDIAAGVLLVREAGGVCLTAEGKEPVLDGRKTSILAGGKTAVAQALEVINGKK